MATNGFTLQVEDVSDLTQIKAEYQVPNELQSCHTAIVDGYIIEGHVPAVEIKRLLSERPKVRGLSVPGMPVGAPGMDINGVTDEAYDVIAFDDHGVASIFARYGS